MATPLLPEGRPGEVAVLGLGRSGRAAAALLARAGRAVYASDAGRGAAATAARDALVPLGVAVELGGHDLARLARAACLVVSPGIPPDAEPLAAARAAGVPIIGEVELALRALPGLRYVAVTGTNGKTTTTALVGQLLRALGHDAPDAGNIGTPVTEVALREPPPPWVALEVSSFQLHDTPSIAPTVGLVTNLSPDHLDRYPDVTTYYADKARLFANAGPDSRWVLNGDDPEVLALHRLLPAGAPNAERLAGRVLRFSLRDPSAEAHLGADGVLHVLGRPLLPRAEFPLEGDHNVANALAAALAVLAADAAHDTPAARAVVAAALRDARPLPHRLAPVHDAGGVRWIDDSKATNVASALVALQGMRRPTVVLLGGRHKGDPYTPLAPELQRTARAVLAYGEAAPLIEADLAGPLAGRVPFERLGSSFDEVIARARALVRPGDAVLLSPACSSYDMFANYVERGTTFARLARGEA